MHVKPARFKHIAREAMATLPAEFQPYLENVVLQVEPYASDELLDELGIPPDDDLLGLYDDSPGSTLLGNADPIQLPPRIVLYYEPLLDACETEAELIREIQITVVHEIGHHFGLDEDRLEKLGYG